MLYGISIIFQSTLGVKAPAKASLFVIAGPVGPYFQTGTFSPVSLLADPRFVRAWPGGIGECKAGGYVIDCCKFFSGEELGF